MEMCAHGRLASFGNPCCIVDTDNADDDDNDDNNEDNNNNNDNNVETNNATITPEDVQESETTPPACTIVTGCSALLFMECRHSTLENVGPNRRGPLKAP
jgi:hypothetical protein